MNSDKITRYRIETTEENKELLPEFIVADTVEGNGKYEYTYIRIDNEIACEDTLIINDNEEFILRAGESVTFDAEKDGIITSIKSSNVDHPYLVRLGYRMVYN